MSNRPGNNASKRHVNANYKLFVISRCGNKRARNRPGKNVSSGRSKPKAENERPNARRRCHWAKPWIKRSRSDCRYRLFVRKSKVRSRNRSQPSRNRNGSARLERESSRSKPPIEHVSIATNSGRKMQLADITERWIRLDLNWRSKYGPERRPTSRRCNR